MVKHPSTNPAGWQGLTTLNGQEVMLSLQRRVWHAPCSHLPIWSSSCIGAHKASARDRCWFLSAACSKWPHVQPLSLSYSHLLFWPQGIHCRGISSLLGFADIRHLSSYLAGIILVATNGCYPGVGFHNKEFLQDGVVSPMLNPPLLSGLGSGWIYSS